VGTPQRVRETARLIRGCLDGEPTAQQDFFRAHRRAVHATLYRILGSNNDIDDLIQEAFIQVFRSLASYRGESSIGTWIGRITTRVAFAHIRKRSRSKSKLRELAEQPSPVSTSVRDDLGHELDARRALEALYNVLGRIDPKLRIAYALHVIDGRSLAEVATMTDASVTATKTRVWRARREVQRRARKIPALVAYLTEQGQMS